jgi:hypothetical protein
MLASEAVQCDIIVLQGNARPEEVCIHGSVGSMPPVQSVSVSFYGSFGVNEKQGSAILCAIITPMSRY